MIVKHPATFLKFKKKRMDAVCLFGFGHVGLKHINESSKKIGNKDRLKTSKICMQNIQKEKRTP